MKWVGRVFLFLLVALAGWLTVSAGVAYVSAHAWREVAQSHQVERLDARFEAAVMTRIETSAFDEDDCRWINDARDVARYLELDRSMRRIELVVAQREVCGVSLDEDALRQLQQRADLNPWNYGDQPTALQFIGDTFDAASILATADAHGYIRYAHALRQAGLTREVNAFFSLPYEQQAAGAEGFLDGTLTAQRIKAHASRTIADIAEKRRRFALEHAYSNSYIIQWMAWGDLDRAANRSNPEAIWQATLVALGQWPEEAGSDQPFARLEREEVVEQLGDLSYRLRNAVAHGHEDATRAFLENGWNRQGEDGNGDGIVWSDRFATPYWWAVHAVRLGDPAYEAELDAAMAHLEAQGCASHARAVGAAWRGVLADFWSDHTPVRDLILERVDCAEAAYDAPEWHWTRRSRSTEPLLGLGEMSIAIDLTL